MQYVQWQTEIVDRQLDSKHTAEVERIEKEGYVTISFDFKWTGLYGESGQPIISKFIGYGTNEQRQEVYGQDIVPSDQQRRLRDLRIKAATQDLSNAELNELIR